MLPITRQANAHEIQVIDLQLQRCYLVSTVITELT